MSVATSMDTEPTLQHQAALLVPTTHAQKSQVQSFLAGTHMGTQSGTCTQTHACTCLGLHAQPNLFQQPRGSTSSMHLAGRSALAEAGRNLPASAASLCCQPAHTTTSQPVLPGTPAAGDARTWSILPSISLEPIARTIQDSTSLAGMSSADWMLENGTCACVHRQYDLTRRCLEAVLAPARRATKCRRAQARCR